MMRANSKAAEGTELALCTRVVQVKRAMLFMVSRFQGSAHAGYLYDAVWSVEDKSHELLALPLDVFEGDIRETRWLRGRDCIGWSEE